MGEGIFGPVQVLGGEAQGNLSQPEGRNRSPGRIDGATSGRIGIPANYLPMVRTSVRCEACVRKVLHAGPSKGGETSREVSEMTSLFINTLTQPRT
jgi:hypothetical protein